MDEVEIVVIGAGVVGLAIASEISKNSQVYVLEKNETFGQETSSRNSEVIHAGIYYPSNSLKAKLCTEGNSLLYKLCQIHSIGCKQLGKLIVAVDEEEVVELEKLLENGRKNGVKLETISKQGIKVHEPELKGVAALLSPSTGIIDSYGLMKHYASAISSNGSFIVYKSKVIEIEKVRDKFKVGVEGPSGNQSIYTRILVNSAGLYSDHLAELAGIDILKAGYKLHYCKGDYFSLNRRLTSRLIYPVPKPKRGGLGIHVTLDLQGRTRLGPNAHYINTLDFCVDEKLKRDFYLSVKKFIPRLDYSDLQPDFCGIRPKLQEQGEDFKDFVIRHEGDKGLEGLINLVGIESPGLTASPAIAKYVKSMIDEI